ncbi:MAG: hypothetical protein A3G34_04715 [Candidatus Lindowbacteria bacterium RIFCSPLOWO2_12_FULL_62_27]|nr:MAG: hypothetical protein A3I06_13035 [Candidatus Lindowbacteria bacterium RIFCSPLOWO2_02_FULL_62_12]OGH61303.1 MAG: hypothetical protein A3G34_04715 [Candidatus Lindowbacteria bacterium RIFCSPLOWO2_12_FULL_62_27]
MALAVLLWMTPEQGFAGGGTTTTSSTTTSSTSTSGGGGGAEPGSILLAILSAVGAGTAWKLRKGKKKQE